ncbi:single-stranded DNA-binding protein [Weissella cibaria]|uniref:single-stranded DNA-binding protein n=1 Tax=Weissella cibaria TaxID=137591 RepID=UPI001E4AB5AE|nr:single-stranded DNA-binding protein [Weissella cibaria]MCC6123123.1 single-stranded DNA-binding protein [Weissella cibaria]
MINRVVLVGRLTKDVELRYTTSGAAVGTFSLAVNRQFTNSNGDRETDFINAVIWRKSAENFANFTSKGSLVAVEGRLQTRNYENQQGQRVYVTEVIVDNFSLLESRAESEQRRNQNNNNQSQDDFNSAPAQQNNFNAQQPQQGGFTPNQMYGNDATSFNEDDLPF